MIDFDPKTNKTICQMPFNHSATTPKGDRLLCCVHRGPPIASKKGIDEFWNSDKMKQIRLDTLSGKEVPECATCYKNEKAGVPSYRLMRVEQNPPDFWEKFTEEELTTGHLKQGPIDFDYRTLLCNLTCMHCGPGFSSAHGKLLEQMKDTLPKNDANEILGIPGMKEAVAVDYEWDKILTQELLDSIERRDLQQIYWAGGEPLMSNMHWDVMDRLSELNETEPEFTANIPIVYNTNLTRATWKGKDAYEILSKFPKINIAPSIDGVGNTFNYIRDGGDWDKVVKNWESLTTHVKEGTKVSIACVVTNLWILDIDNFLNFFEQYDYPMTPQPLMRHDINYNVPRYQILDQIIFTHILDVNWIPEDIIIPAMDYAIERLKRSTIGAGAQTAIDIIKNAREERIEKGDKMVSLAPRIKLYANFREKFKKDGTTFGSVLKETNTEAWMWYNSIVPKWEC